MESTNLETKSLKKKKRRDNKQNDGFEEWGGYMEAKISKLSEQFKGDTCNSIKPLSDIFCGVAIFVNGYTDPPANELKTLMASHGGSFHLYQMSGTSGATTHVIASNLPNVKIKQLGSTPIVKADWITESISAGRLLDYTKYLLYTNVNSKQPTLDFPLLFKQKDSEIDEEKMRTTRDINESKPSVVKPAQSSSSSVCKTAADPQFLTEFYNNSRLHLISTLGTEFKQLITNLREKSNGVFSGRTKLSNIEKTTVVNDQVVVMHIDMDCFFVSVGLRNKPELRGYPIAVTHAKNSQGPVNRSEANLKMELELLKTYRPRANVDNLDTHSSMSEIASCSYEARKCGIKNGMFLGSAIKLCPNLKTIAYDFEGYKEVSHILYNTIASYTLDIEAVSCDEMYVNVGPLLKEFQISVEQWATHIRREIMEATSCPCSTGFGANRLQARLATKKAKPSGQYYLQPNYLEEYMTGISLSDLPGVGYATVAKLNAMGLKTCGDVQKTSLSCLQSELGPKNGLVIFEQAQGIDKKPLNYHYERKSISADVNYGIRFKNKTEAVNFLLSLSNEVWHRLEDINMKAKCLTLKLLVRAPEAPEKTAKFLGCGVCNAINRSVTGCSLNDPSSIFKETVTLFDQMNIEPKELRGVGIQLTKLEKMVSTNSNLNKFLTKNNKKDTNANGAVEKKVTNKSDTKAIWVDKKKTSKGKVNSLSNYFQQQKSNWVSLQGNIDVSILRELPKHVLDEVVKDYNLGDKFAIVEEDLNKPKEINDTESSKEKCTPFDNLQWEDLKPIIINWFESKQEPNKFDVAIIADHFKQLAIDRKIETLQVVVNFLYRRISKLKLCSWHEAYMTIIETIQNGMITIYGNTLYCKTKFDCSQHR